MLQQRLSRSLQTLARQSPVVPATRRSFIPSRASTFNNAPVALHRLTSPRWYSSAQEPEAKTNEASKEQAEAKKEETPKAETEAQKAADTDPVQKELEAKKKEVIDLTDRVKRSMADYRSLQEQTRREVRIAKDFALQKFAKDILDSVDNLGRALETVDKAKLTDENPELVKLHGGLQLTEDILLATLKRHGLEPIDSNGEVYDATKHEATFQAPMKGKEDGTVFFTERKGFTYNGRTLRQAKVGVVKNS